MKVTNRDLRLARAKAKREWVRTQWREVEEIASQQGLCYSTWYDRVRSGKSPLEAASYPPCPIKGRKIKKGES